MFGVNIIRSLIERENILRLLQITDRHLRSFLFALYHGDPKVSKLRVRFDLHEFPMLPLTGEKYHGNTALTSYIYCIK